MEEKVNKLVTDVALLNQKVDLLMKNLRCSAHENKFEDHESRIRDLEDYRNQAAGEKKIYGIISSAIVAIIVGTIVGVIVRLV